MLLSFESLNELESIIAAMGYVKRESVATITQGDVSISGPAALVLAEHPFVDPDWIKYAQEPRRDDGQDSNEGNESAPAGELTAGATTGSTESAADTAASEAPKRKRRTKAEMEAARAAESDTSESTTSFSNVEAASVPSTNPFEANAASPTTQAILNAPNQQAATLAGIAAMQAQSPFDAPTDATTTPVEASTVVSKEVGDAGMFIEQRALEILSTQTEPLTAVKHMHFCRDFIAKHKQEKYLQGFALAGLPSAIGAYKAEQCARHQAALEFLELN